MPIIDIHIHIQPLEMFKPHALELIKRGLVLALQEQEFGEIDLVVHEVLVDGAPKPPENQL